MAVVRDLESDRLCFSAFRLPANRNDEPIAAAGQRLDESRHVRRVPKRISQAANRGIQAALEIDERLCRPQTLSQLLAGDEVAWTIQQCPENLKRLIGKTDPNPAPAQLAGAEIQLERSEPNEIIHGLGHSDGGSSVHPRRAGILTRLVTPTRICMSA